MTDKRFKCHLGVVGVHIGVGTDEHELTGDECRDLLNKLLDENVMLKFQLQNTSAQRNEFHRGARENANRVGKLEKENEQLKQDNASLIKLLENQSIIIQKLHSKILEFELKEPIVSTKEDLELMDKAISYYTHGRYGE